LSFFLKRGDKLLKSRGFLIALLVFGVLAVFAVGVLLWAMGVYNSLVTADEGVASAWGQVETQYQRRADLIPNLVATVRRFADQEREVLQNVVEARAKVGQMTVTKEVLEDPESFAKFQAAQDGFTSAISRLMAVVENYPDLRSNENFLTLQDQLEGTENRIAVERRRYNEYVQAYNTTIRRFPGSLVAGFGGFHEKQYFKASEGSGEAPKVSF
jgi:LemA protein